MFENAKKQDVKDLEAKIDDLNREVRALTRKAAEAKEEVGYSDQIVALKKTISTLEIERDKEEEGFARERREVEHMVGLERRRSEFEKDAARREAELEVREQNLSIVQENLQKQIDFMVKRFTEEVKYLKDDVLKVVVSALPNVNVELGHALNGKAKTDVDA